MIAGVPAENNPNDRRVALVPAVVPALTKMKLDVLVEAGAGLGAGFPNQAYLDKGARIAGNRAEVFGCDIVLHVHLPAGDFSSYRAGQVVLGLLNPLGDAEKIRALAETGVLAFAFELLPRITRAQSMDALTSMATLAGYKAVLLAADTLDKMFPLMMTAAGTITPARVFVIGAGVAGLQAIATARRLGAVVQGYDVRPAVQEQVESLGAKFLQIETTAQAEAGGGYARAMDEDFYRRQREAMAKAVADSDVAITTAAVPGKKAPVLITDAMVQGMRPGSVIVDLAAETGGNCELTSPGEIIVVHGVTVLGPVNLASMLPYDASQMYARNIAAFLGGLIKDGQLQLNLDDEILRDTLVTREREVVQPRVRELLGA